MARYETLSQNIIDAINDDKLNNRKNPFAFSGDDVVRRHVNPHDDASVWRTAFIRDVDKILHCPFYNRYVDKTQVLSLYKNDDISRRSLHVQLVSRTARTIGKALGLNEDLIEAIALGHDIGHTPFGHAGERFLDELYHERTGRRFFHNVHSVRVLDKLFGLNVSLQTLNGVLSHNGELELCEYYPKRQLSFTEFDKDFEACYTDGESIYRLIPSTLEGCVVRISDIIAYLGKDRHDAQKSDIASEFIDFGIGVTNAEIINNLIVNIIENSYGKPYIKLDEAHFKAIQQAKAENYENIYGNPIVKRKYDIVKDMMGLLYEKLLTDFNSGLKSSPIFTAHIEYLDKPYYRKYAPYPDTEANQIVLDYIASMTDDYMIDLFKHLFPKSNLKLEYVGYFK
ncbi:MAG: HD domain-containing protein [Clostridiales bacterium]|nr:HD domain-containing protein [Clostridiales bacterium]